MKINEVEKQVGITSKNIRFYEKEGLLTPKRNSENGYREYSSDDIIQLKTIKLLRKLGISVNDIRLLQAERSNLTTVLNKQMEYLNHQINDLLTAKKLCLKICEDTHKLNEISTEQWLSEISSFEKKGVEFVNLNNDEIIRCLPDKFKIQYYEEIIKNGQIDNDLLKEITLYFEEIYKKSVDTEELLIDTFKKVDSNQKARLLSILKQNNMELYNKLANNIYDFEDIINTDITLAKGILKHFDMSIIIKASMGASPCANKYIQTLFPHFDFTKAKQELRSIPINEIEKSQNDIIDAINKELGK